MKPKLKSLGIYDCRIAKDCLFDNDGASLFARNQKQRKAHLKLFVPYIGKKIRVFFEVVE